MNGDSFAEVLLVYI